MSRNSSCGNDSPPSLIDTIYRTCGRITATQCQEIILQGVDILATDESENTAFHAAASYGRRSICELLLRHSSNLLNLKNASGDTALHLAVLRRDLDFCKWLARQGADMHAENVDGEIPLHLAAEGGQTEICQFLLSEKCLDINGKTRDGHTPLHEAAANGHPETCRLLLQYGADVNAKNQECCTALHQAAISGNAGVCSILMTYGADVTAKNLDGKTPFEVGQEHGHDLRQIECDLKMVRTFMTNILVFQVMAMATIASLGK